MAPQARVLVVELFERELRRQDGVHDVVHLPVARGDLLLRRVPQIRSGQRREDGEAAVVGAHGVDPVAQAGEVFAVPRRIDNEVRREADAEVFEDIDGFDVVVRRVLLVDSFQALIGH